MYIYIYMYVYIYIYTNKYIYIYMYIYILTIAYFQGWGENKYTMYLAYLEEDMQCGPLCPESPPPARQGHKRRQKQ